jgi:hypothetical protein
MTLISPKNFTQINENSYLNKLVGFLDIYDVILIIILYKVIKSLLKLILLIYI